MSKQTQFKKASKINGWEIIVLGLSSLKSNKLRSSLTILGIAIGVFSVVGVMTILSAIRQSIDSSLQVLGGEVFDISRMPQMQMNDGWWNYRHRPVIDYRDARRFKMMMEENSDVLVVMHMRDGGEMATYKDRKSSRNLRIIGTNENHLDCFPQDVEFGRNLTSEDIEFNRAVTVIGSDVAKQLFPNEDPLGKTINQKGSRYEVVGILKEKGQTMGNNPDRVVLIPITRFLSSNFNRHRSMSLTVKAPNKLEMEFYQDMAVGYLRIIRGLEPEDPNNFEVFSNDAALETFAKIAVVIGSGGLVISAIALLTAGVGVMNIMLVSVTERTREIGIRKSVGARSKDILKQFLLEAVFLSEVGGLIGIILGVLGGNSVAIIMDVTVIFPWLWAGVAVVTCSVIGVSFGMYPAWKASRLHPIDALRFE